MLALSVDDVETKRLRPRHAPHTSAVFWELRESERETVRESMSAKAEEGAAAISNSLLSSLRQCHTSARRPTRPRTRTLSENAPCSSESRVLAVSVPQIDSAHFFSCQSFSSVHADRFGNGGPSFYPALGAECARCSTGMVTKVYLSRRNELNAKLRTRAG